MVALMKIYLAGPLFTLAERNFNLGLARHIETSFSATVILPQERAAALLAQDDGMRLVFEDCINMVRECDVIVAILDGSDADSGTCVELGFALALGKKIVGLRTDFRISEHQGLNLMVSHVCSSLILDTTGSLEELGNKVVEALAQH